MRVGEYVTRKSYNNDIIFKIISIDQDVCYLKGVSVRLYADSLKDDLLKCDVKKDIDDNREFLSKIKECKLERSDYFYLPGKILHLDGDEEYLNRCLKYYKDINIMAMGVLVSENKMSFEITRLLKEYNPNILVITGHDAYYKKKGSIDDIASYKNSKNFVNAVKEARKFESSHQKLIIIAGACQSDYEELIKAGANFASSPKRINIHALDPAIIASRMSLSDSNLDIDLKDIIENTKYGKEGIGGIITKGTMYRGYPR